MQFVAGTLISIIFLLCAANCCYKCYKRVAKAKKDRETKKPRFSNLKAQTFPFSRNPPQKLEIGLTKDEGSIISQSADDTPAITKVAED